MNPVSTSPTPAASPWDEVAAHYRRASVQRLRGGLAEISTALAGALARAAAETAGPEEFERRRQELFAAEEARVQQAALTAELVALFLARDPAPGGTTPVGTLPSRPPARSRPVLPPSENEAIAGLIDGMLAQSERPAGR